MMKKYSKKVVKNDLMKGVGLKRDFYIYYKINENCVLYVIYEVNKRRLEIYLRNFFQKRDYRLAFGQISDFGNIKFMVDEAHKRLIQEKVIPNNFGEETFDGVDYYF